MEILLSFFVRVTPGLVVVAVVFLLLPRVQVVARVFVLILGFILMRDAMTPEGIWSFGITPPAIWLRFTDDFTVLFVLGALSGVLAIVLLRTPGLRSLPRWGKPRSWKTYVVGVLAGVIVAAPFVALSVATPTADRGGATPLAVLPALLWMALLGNFLEEVLFRGFLQSHWEKHMSQLRAAALSALTFTAAHIFLAMTVTDLGWPVLVFVLIEGVACALVYRKYGLISASLTHGIAIFALASGVV